MKIGFIGLGIMGRPMARNLVRAGYDLTVYDLNAEAVADLVSCGAKAAGSSKEASLGAEAVITMVPNSPQVREVVLGKDGVIEGASKGTVLIDMSSIDPTESRKIGKELEKFGIDMMDAPVSGGEPKAIDGTLSVMVGGREEQFDRCYDMLKVMAGSVVYVGALGAGQPDYSSSKYRSCLRGADLCKEGRDGPGAGISGNQGRSGWFYCFGCKSTHDA